MTLTKTHKQKAEYQMRKLRVKKYTLQVNQEYGLLDKTKLEIKNILKEYKCSHLQLTVEEQRVLKRANKLYHYNKLRESVGHRTNYIQSLEDKIERIDAI